MIKLPEIFLEVCNLSMKFDLIFFSTDIFLFFDIYFISGSLIFSIWPDLSPTINVSLVDLSFIASRKTSVDEINEVVKAASDGPLKGVLDYNDGPLVSIDFNHNPASSTYDATMTKVQEGTLVKVCSWYDNEWGFSNRMLDTTLALINAE